MQGPTESKLQIERLIDLRAKATLKKLQRLFRIVAERDEALRAGLIAGINFIDLFVMAHDGMTEAELAEVMVKAKPIEPPPMPVPAVGDPKHSTSNRIAALKARNYAGRTETVAGKVKAFLVERQTKVGDIITMKMLRARFPNLSYYAAHAAMKAHPSFSQVGPATWKASADI